MNCRRVSSLISAYIDGELTGIEMLEIRRHLDTCKSCSLQYESLRYTKQLLSSISYAQPREGLAERIAARLDSVQTPSYQRLLNRLLTYCRTRLTPVAAGCAALGAMLMVLAINPSNEPEITTASVPVLHTVTLPLKPPSVSTMPAISMHSEQPRLIIPESNPNNLGDPRFFSLTSFEGY